MPGNTTALLALAVEGPVTDSGGQLFNVKAFGAKGDDATDDTATFQACANAAAALWGKVFVPPAVYRINGTVSLDSNLIFEGTMGSVLRSPAGRSTPLIDISGKSRVIVRDLVLDKASGATMTATAYGVYVHGDSEDILIENVFAGGATVPADGVRGDGFVTSFQIDGSSGTDGAAGTCKRVVLRNCHGRNSPTLWNFNAEDCESITLVNCYGQGAWLDGFKFRGKNFNGTVCGGEFSYNGISASGDGGDVFSGGNTVLVDGTVFRSNHGAAITVKCDTSLSGDPNFGDVTRVMLRNLRGFGNQVGIYLTQNNPGTATERVVDHVVIDGCVMNDSAGPAADGYYIGGRNVVVCNCTGTGNGRYGLITSSRAFDVTLRDNDIQANAVYNLELQGERIRVYAGRYYGVDSTTVAAYDSTDAAVVDLPSLTPVTVNCIHVNVTAVDVKMWEPAVGFQSDTFVPIKVDMTTGVCQIHRSGTGTPYGQTLLGSKGSTWLRTDGGFGSTQFTKTGGNPNDGTNWTRDVPVVTGSQTVNTTQTAIAHGCGYTPLAVSIKSRTNATVWQSAVPDATNVYLTASATATVDIACH